MSQTRCKLFCLLLFTGFSIAACSDNKNTPPVAADLKATTLLAATSTATRSQEADEVQGEQDIQLREAKVVETLHTFGPNTTYLQLEANNQRFWVASGKLDTKVGDTVRYSIDQAIRMEKFNSKALNRIFDSILFIPEVEILASAKTENANSPAKDTTTNQSSTKSSKEN